jgi:hypothetical protein
MRFTVLIGSQADAIQHQSIKPKHYPCSQCGTKGKRKHVITRRIAHVAVLHRRSWLVAEVGVYKTRGACCKYFQAPLPGVPYRGRYAYEVRNAVANALIRDRVPYGTVIRRMQEDYGLELSLGISIPASCGRMRRSIWRATGILSEPTFQGSYIDFSSRFFEMPELR